MSLQIGEALEAFEAVWEGCERVGGEIQEDQIRKFSDVRAQGRELFTGL